VSGSTSPATPSGAAGSGTARIAAALAAARTARRPAIVAFLTGGYPNLERFPGLLEAVSGAADIVEIGVPWSDPMADGATIQEASHVALEAGTTLPFILEAAAGRQGGPPIVLMSYLNPLLAFGLRRVAAAARTAAIAGFIIPDLPCEEGGGFGALCDDEGLALVQMVTPVTPDDRIETIGRASRGFLYAVTATGTTGGMVASGGGTTGYLDRVRARAPLPGIAGFGVRTGRQVRDFAPHCDGVIVGSALVEAIGRGEDPGLFLRRLVEEAR
jgi:tryptophan synthase alpha chain